MLQNAAIVPVLTGVTTMLNRDIYQEVTNKILAQLEKGTLPWVKPWAATPGNNVPCNAVSNRPYSGTNVILLWLSNASCFPTPRFLTFKQAKEAGGTVNAGEHGFKVVFMKQLVVKDKNAAESDATKIVPMLREYTVFNVAQCSGLPDRIVKGPTVAKVRNPDYRDETADEFIAATKAEILYGHGQAFYAPSKDVICMPAFETFMGADQFYNTIFHELTHWTAHKDRCARDLKGRFGDKAYAAEELIAQLGAAFLCAEFAFDGECQDASYIAHWIRLLKDDKKAFLTAASAAQKAADYLRGKALEESEVVEQAAA
jgi:antirestriction protein ArdC